MVHSYVDFVVERKRHGRTIVLPMPQQPYELTVTNTTVGSMNQSISRFTGLVVGSTDVQLINRNVDAAVFTRVPTGTVHVISPGHLGFEISGGNWMLELNKTYDVTIHVYNRQNRRLRVTDNVRILAGFPQFYFDVLYSTVNGSFHTVRPLNVGDVTLLGDLRAVVIEESGESHQFKPSITGDQPAEIYSSITIVPQLVVLPWDPQLVGHYDYQLEAVGGSGEYDWSIDKRSVGRMADQGLVTVVGQGAAKPKAADNKNSAIFNTSQLFVVPPAEIKFLLAEVEALIGKRIDLPLSVKGLIQEDGKEHMVLFNDCRKLQFKWEFSDSGIFKIINYTDYNLSDLWNGSCGFVRVEALKQGHTTLTATYKRSGVALTASILLGGYPPLKLILPSQPALVTLASSYLYQFEGGPLPWPLDHLGFTRNLKSGDENAVKNEGIGERRVASHAYRVHCRQLGDQNLTLTVRNRPSARNPFPASASIHTSILCRLPISAQLQPHLLPDVVRSCPSITDEKQVVHVASDQQISLVLTVQDNDGQDFDNFTSLDWHWEKTVDDIVEFLEGNSPPNQDGNKAVQRVQVSGRQSSVELSATSNNYLSDYLTNINLNSKEALGSSVRDTLMFRIESAPSIIPASLILYNHYDNSEALSIQNGSGFYHVELRQSTADDVIEYDHDARSNQVKVIPLHDGRVNVVARDLCLISTETSTSAIVYVSGIYRFNVQVVDKVQVGGSIVAVVRVIDRWGNSFPSSQYRYMNLRAHALQPILDFSNVTQKQYNLVSDENRKDSVLFSLNGLIEGMTQIVFNATAPGNQLITSDPSTIHVFSELKVDPAEVVLIPTATFQILVTGGPRHDARLVFTSLNMTVCSVDSAGLITAVMPGHTTVTVVSQSGETERIVYSEATVLVTVLKLTGIKIAAPTNQLLIGTEIAVYATDRNTETPFSFVSAVHGLTFHWSSSNVDLVSLHSVYDKAGYTLQTDPDFAVRLRTNKVGRSRVSLQARCPPNACEPDEATFSDTLDVQVLEYLQLIYPKDGRLLLPHNAHSLIRTNRDGNSQILYSIFSPQNNHYGQASDTSVIRVSANGQITTGSLDGEFVVVVTSVESYGFNQTVLVYVEVKPIRSLTIVSLSDVRANENHIHAFPIGYSAPYSVSLHDAVGRSFDVADVPIRYRMNRFDVMRIEMSAGNGTFIVKGVKIGQVILKMWIPSLPQVTDYIRVRVGYALRPMPAIIHLGSTVCFATHLHFEHGIWSSSNVNVIQINNYTGAATALSTGPTLISYAAEEIVNTHIEVTVTAVQRVNLDPPTQLLISNWFPRRQNMLRIPVTFVTDVEGKEFSPVVDRGLDCDQADAKNYKQQVQFECRLSFELLETNRHAISASDVFECSAVFDSVTGLSYCQLVPVVVNSVAVLGISQLEGTLGVQVNAFDSRKTYVVVSDALEISFIGAFGLLQHRIELSSERMSGEVLVSGTEKMLSSLEVNCQHSSLSAHLVREDPTSIHAVVQLKLKSVRDIAAYEVFVVSRLTGQSETITVAMAESHSLLTNQPLEQQPAETDYTAVIPHVNWTEIATIIEPYFTWKTLLAVIILLIILVLSCYILYARSGPATSAQHPVFQPSSPVSSPAFPSGTPNTPQTTFSHSGSISPFHPVGQIGQSYDVRSPLPPKLFSES